MTWGARKSGFSAVDSQLIGISGLSRPEILKPALQAGAQPFAEAARGLVRVRTGRLRDSIAVGDQLPPHAASVDQSSGALVEVFVGPGPYPEATTEEFGTLHEAPHPFMRPAWEQQQGAAVDAIVANLSGEFDRRAGG